MTSAALSECLFRRPGAIAACLCACIAAGCASAPHELPPRAANLPVIATLRISLAVASSSSVPLLIGPVTYSIQGKDGQKELLHIGDGGMFDNQGIESLAQVMFPKLMPTVNAPSARRHGLMLVVDASYPFDGGGDLYAHADGLLAMLDKSPGRISDIMEQRTSTYQLLLWGSLRSTQDNNHEIVPDPEHLTIVYFRHTDAYSALSKAPPPECTQWSSTKPSEAEML